MKIEDTPEARHICKLFNVPPYIVGIGKAPLWRRVRNYFYKARR